MDKQVQKMLRDVFGFRDFRPGQREIIAHLLAGRSALAVFPTGAGKSLCYQLPALLLEGMTLVVSPLIALMKDQIDFLRSKDVRAARLDSSLGADEARQVWADLRNGDLKLLYVAPERFASERFFQRLASKRIALMVVDEAHCISEWGHNFRPDYLKLAEHARGLGAERVLALTATATPAVARDICKGFAIPPDAYVNTGFHRPNLEIRSRPCRATERDDLLLERLRERPRGSTIIYVTLQKTAERVADNLSAGGINARAYHAGMQGDLRGEVQDWFMSRDDAVVVATIAFGMGIDKPDIRTVYHYNMPKSLENYMQETGRAGRDGQPSVCELFACPDDVAALENFAYGDTPTAEAVHALVADLMAQDDAFDISIHELAAQYDIRTLVVSTLLSYLELKHIIRSTGPFYDEYRFQPHRSSAEMLEGFDAERTRFLKAMFAATRKGRTWYAIDIASTAEAIEQPRQRLVAALNFLEERGDIELRVAGVRHGYRFLQRPASVSALADELHQRFRESEARDIARIQQVLDLATRPSCTVREVLTYFGEDLGGDCGHCDRCLGETMPPLPPLSRSEPSPDDLETIRSLLDEQHAALATPRQLTRFLCGLSSPAAARARLTRDERFGRMAHLRFRTVLDAVERLSKTDEPA